MTLKQTNRAFGFGIVLMLYMNYLASATETLWLSMTNLSTIFPFSFMPPARAFMASWGLIYLSLLVFFVLFVRYTNTLAKATPETNTISKLFWTAIILNILWVVSTTQQRWWISLVIIAGLMYVLYKMVKSLITTNSTLNARGRFSRGIYLGWITVATIILGISQVIYSRSVQGASRVMSSRWLYGILALWLIKTIAIYYKTRNPYALGWSIFALAACAFAAYSTMV